MQHVINVQPDVELHDDPGKHEGCHGQVQQGGRGQGITIFKLYNFKILFFVYWGIEQVKREKGGYAFMMESASIQYIIERECDLGQCYTYTDKKEDQIFLIYKEIQKGAVAKSYMTNGLLMYDKIFTHFSYRKPFLI